MSRCGLVGLLAILCVAGGCISTRVVTQTNEGETAPTRSTTSNTDQDARGRARLHAELAANYYEIRNLAIALEEAGIAQRADPTYGPSFNVAGLIYQELRNDSMAEESFRQALRINARDPDANNNYGAFLCNRKREADGIRHFLLAVTDPLYRMPERSYVNAGLCARRINENTAAEEYFRSALKSQPASQIALYQLGDLAYAKGNFAVARSYLQRLAPAAETGSPEVLWLMLRTERRAGDTATQQSLAYQLRTRFPDSREAALMAEGRFD